MTVANQTNKVQATGNSSATVFSFSPMVINKAADLVVTLETAGVESTLVEGSGSTNYSIDITTFPATGSITYPADAVTPIDSTNTLTMKRVLTLEQDTDLENQGGYFPDVQEDTFDRMVMIDLQQQEETDRTLKGPVSDVSGLTYELPPVSTRKDQLLAFDTNGNVITTSAGVDTAIVSTFMLTVLDDTTAAAARTTLVAASSGANSDITSLTGLTTDLTVAQGGTGAGTFTDGGILLGSGTGAITAMGALAKGSIVAGDGTTDPIARAVGSNTQVLTADSAETDGIKWAAPAAAITHKTLQATTSGTAFNFTGVAAGTNRITIMFRGVSFDGSTDSMEIQIGPSGGLETTGYVASSSRAGATNSVTALSSTSGFVVRMAEAGAIVSGIMTLVRTDGNIWIASHSLSNTTVANTVGGGDKALAGELALVTLIRLGSTDAFDAGSINIFTE